MMTDISLGRPAKHHAVLRSPLSPPCFALRPISQLSEYPEASLLSQRPLFGCFGRRCSRRGESLILAVAACAMELRCNVGAMPWEVEMLGSKR